MTASPPARVMIVDDHSIMRDGLREMLERSEDFQVAGQARDGCEAVDVARRVKPDVIIMDVIMPVKNGVDACREIMEAVPGTRVLMLTASTNDHTVIDAIAAGATGYLQKFTGKDELLATIRDVVDGEFRVPGDVVRRAFAGVRDSSGEDAGSELSRLTVREQEILKLFAEGMSYADIAEARGNRPLTIRNAIYGIREKLGAGSSQEMVVWAVRNGLLDND
ncbi:MAG: response regulator transcription factor [Chloroflexota bacterium]|nr:response regulator transcription factor [Chloroflexota bacterium]